MPLPRTGGHRHLEFERHRRLVLEQPLPRVGRNRSTDRSYGGNITAGLGELALVKQGSSKLTLTGDHSFTGSSMVAAGTLAGTGAAASAATVKAGATLAPGVGVGDFICDATTLETGSTPAIEINSSTRAADALDPLDLVIQPGVTLTALEATSPHLARTASKGIDGTAGRIRM